MHLEFEAVTKYYFTKSEVTTAVSELCWQAEPGRVYGVIGPDGSGKTTLKERRYRF